MLRVPSNVSVTSNSRSDFFVCVCLVFYLFIFLFQKGEVRSSQKVMRSELTFTTISINLYIT